MRRKSCILFTVLFCFIYCFIAGPHEFNFYFGFCDLRTMAGYLTSFGLRSLVSVFHTLRLECRTLEDIGDFVEGAEGLFEDEFNLPRRQVRLNGCFGGLKQ